MIIMGGPCAERKERPIWLCMCHTDRFNEYDEPIDMLVIGVGSIDDYEISREHVWEKKLKSAEAEKFNSASDCGHLEFCQ